MVGRVQRNPYKGKDLQTKKTERHSSFWGKKGRTETITRKKGGWVEG